MPTQDQNTEKSGFERAKIICQSAIHGAQRAIKNYQGQGVRINTNHVVAAYLLAIESVLPQMKDSAENLEDTAQLLEELAKDIRKGEFNGAR